MKKIILNFLQKVQNLFIGPYIVPYDKNIRKKNQVHVTYVVSTIFFLIFFLIILSPKQAFSDLGYFFSYPSINGNPLVTTLIIGGFSILVIFIGIGVFFLRKKNMIGLEEGCSLFLFFFNIYFIIIESKAYGVNNDNWLIFMVFTIPLVIATICLLIKSVRFIYKLFYKDTYDKEIRRIDYNFRVNQVKKSFSRFIKYIRKNWGQVLTMITLLTLAVSVLYPLTILVMRSFKYLPDDLMDPFGIPSRFTFTNYTYMWEYLKQAYINSLLTTVGVTIGVVILASMVAFAYIRFNFPGKNILFYAIIGLMMIPGILTLISRFQLVNDMKLTGNLWGIILPGIAGGIPFSFMLLFTFFKGIPKDLFEASDMDGASNLTIFRHVVVPLSKPILFTIGIQSFVGEWNDYLWAKLIIGSNESIITLPVILQSISTAYETQYLGMSTPFAGYVLSAIPLVLIFIVASKQFIEGLTSGAFKM